MAKGDREIHKADIEDGYTKIANLLLEALAIAKLNGVQKGICLFLCRRTYGWKQKSDQISLREFSEACGTSESYISKQIKQLVAWRIIVRLSYKSGKTPVYTFNTMLSEWDCKCISMENLKNLEEQGLYISVLHNCARVEQKDKGCTNVQGLNDCTRKGLHKCARVPLYDCARVDQSSDQVSREVEPPLKKEERNIKENNNDHDHSTAQEENLYRIFEQEFGRPLSPMEIDLVASWQENKKLSRELILEALKRAVLNNKFNFKYINTILFDWTKNNVRTLHDIAMLDLEFEQRKAKNKSGKSRASPPWGNPKNEDREKELIKQLYQN